MQISQARNPLTDLLAIAIKSSLAYVGWGKWLNLFFLIKHTHTHNDDCLAASDKNFTIFYLQDFFFFIHAKHFAPFHTRTENSLTNIVFARACATCFFYINNISKERKTERGRVGEREGERTVIRYDKDCIVKRKQRMSSTFQNYSFFFVASFWLSA